MKNSRFTEVQIIKILSEQQQGKTVNEICRANGISQPTFYKWKSKYGEPTTPRDFLLKYGKLSHTSPAEFPTFQQNFYSDNNNLLTKNSTFECT